MNHRADIIRALQDAGFKIKELSSDTSDPFAWSLVACKDEYEIRIQERAKSLCDS